MGYANGSPYSGNPYLDIETPKGLITMADTPIDLLGIDNLGNVKKMKAGRKNPYKFAGQVVREIPLQEGGLTQKQMFDFIFDDDEEEKKDPVKASANTAPTAEEVAPDRFDNTLDDEQMEGISMEMVMQDRAQRGNPYGQRNSPSKTGNPYIDNPEIISSGQFGSQNVGQYGRKIYSELASHLGYNPVANSIYRSEEQNNALIAKGLPAVKNSWHLTGNAVDIKPADWYNLSNEQQQYYRTHYDVVYHNNHYHIEPK